MSMINMRKHFIIIVILTLISRARCGLGGDLLQIFDNKINVAKQTISGMIQFGKNIVRGPVEKRNLEQTSLEDKIAFKIHNILQQMGSHVEEFFQKSKQPTESYQTAKAVNTTQFGTQTIIQKLSYLNDCSESKISSEFSASNSEEKPLKLNNLKDEWLFNKVLKIAEKLGNTSSISPSEDIKSRTTGKSYKKLPKYYFNPINTPEGWE